MVKLVLGFLALAICAIAFDSFTTRQARNRITAELKADAPGTVPSIAQPTLKQGLFFCETHNLGQSDQYMTCWMPSHDASAASLALFGPVSRLWAVMFGPAGNTVPDRPGGVPIAAIASTDARALAASFKPNLEG